MFFYLTNLLGNLPKRFVEPEELPAQYGGLKREEDGDFTPEDKASRLKVKPSTNACIEIPVAEVLLQLLQTTNISSFS